MSTPPPSYFREVIPNGCRRAPWHDYHGRSIYMITLNRRRDLPPLSTLEGIPGDRQWKPRAVLTPVGEIVARHLSSLKDRFPEIKLLRRVIMPEHIHFVIFVTRPTEYSLGEIIGCLKRDCTCDFRSIAGRPDASLFEDGFHDRILLGRGQLQRMLNYISDNPARRLARMARPGYHHRFLLTDSDGSMYEAYGNPDLLADPDIAAVRISSRFAPGELLEHKRLWLRTIENGGVLVSPFISDAEKRVRDYAYANGGRVIIIENNGFGKIFSPKEPLHTLCGEGRILIIAPTVWHAKTLRVTREECMAMNGLAGRVASYGLRPVSPFCRIDKKM